MYGVSGKFWILTGALWVFLNVTSMHAFSYGKETNYSKFHLNSLFNLTDQNPACIIVVSGHFTKIYVFRKQ